MEIKFPSNLSDKKYGKFAHGFESSQHAIECAEQGHAVIYWDNPKVPDEEPTRAVGFLQGVTYSHHGVKYRVMTVGGFVFNYDHALPIEDGHCPRVFVNTGNGAGTGRLIGIQCDEDTVGEHPKFIVRLLPFEGGIWDTVTADQLLFVDDTKMGVAKEA